MKLPDSLYKKIARNPSIVLGFSFIILILCGTILLALPVASADGKSCGLIDALFTSTSASCVTGLIAKDTASGWSLFGKTVIVSLIQIGGLGTMTMMAWVSIFIGKRIGLSGRIFIKEQLNADSLSGLVKLLRFATLLTLSVEGMGAFLLSFRFVPMYGLTKGMGYSIFHAISAFCNAGFDLFGDSLMSFQGDYYITLIIAFLIIFGGLGFIVYIDIWRYPNRRRLSHHTKLVLVTTIVLLIAGSAIFYMLEATEGGSIASLTISEQCLASFFQSTTFRTAGFNSVDLSQMHDTTTFLSLLLMFIGGSPGSTAGGIKTTTFAVVIWATFSTLRGLNDVELFNRRVSDGVIRKAFALFVVAVALVFFVAFCMAFFEKGQFKFIDILFESFSAFGTVGVTKGLTQNLTAQSKLILALTMYIGRIGPTTFTMGLFHKLHAKKYRLAEGKFIVG